MSGARNRIGFPYSATGLETELKKLGNRSEDPDRKLSGRQLIDGIFREVLEIAREIRRKLLG